MGNIGTARMINLALAFIIGVCAGGISGYLIGGFPPPAAPGQGDHGMPIHYPEALSVENAWILEGFSCPEPACTNTLLACQGNLPRRICSWVNEQLAKGRSGEDIRAALIRQHGEKLDKLRGTSPE
ncbi:MAG TPA: hypothetical protein VM118_03580 [Acidobacteriota bacterium]|nr:hypothetical protein [Acidobacteriota bacterium]